jgi:hypothetical protein
MPSMSETSSAVGGLIGGLVKFALTLAGFGAGIYGVATQQWGFVWLGAGLLVLGQVVHSIDQRLLDKQLQAWAEEATAGIGPVPPRAVRKEFAHRAMATEGFSGDVSASFKSSCRQWAYEH